MWVVPRYVEGVIHLRGAEANIMAMDGTIDLRENDQRFVDILIASLHGYCVKPVNSMAHTQAYDAVLSNPYVDILGHPASMSFPFDEEYVVKRCAQTGKMIELNPHAMLMSPATIEINRRLLRLCKKYGTTVTLGSDAHVCYEIGTFEKTMLLLAEENFPEELVFNANLARIVDYVNAKPNVKSKIELK